MSATTRVIAVRVVVLTRVVLRVVLHMMFTRLVHLGFP